MSSAALFFDSQEYVRTVVVEKTDAASAAEAEGAVGLAGCGPGSAVLDAGCGTGRHSHPLASAGYRVVGLDSSRVLLTAALSATHHGMQPRFVRGSFAALPFGPGSFETVLCLGTALGYLGDAADRIAIREFRRVLAPGGRLVVETLHRGEIGGRLSEFEERPLPSGATLRFARRFDRQRGVMHETQRLAYAGGDGLPYSYDVRVYGEDELRRMLEAAGFAITERHASLAGGGGEPSAVTPLVLVAEAT